MMTPILEARGLMKRYGKTQALAGLDLVVNPGRVVALLGPNGAGKTTFVRAVATLLRPDAGTLHVDGIDALRKPANPNRDVTARKAERSPWTVV
jgi:ABC-2 type transport system ATP-binding protein